METPKRFDVVIEMVRGDVLPRRDSDLLARHIAAALAPDACVGSGVSELEAHGEPWWLALHLWCLSPRSQQALVRVSNAAVRWSTDWRSQCARRRPVYATLRDPSGRRLDGFLVRDELRRLPPVAGTVRAFPLMCDDADPGDPPPPRAVATVRPWLVRS